MLGGQESGIEEEKEKVEVELKGGMVKFFANDLHNSVCRSSA